MAQAGIKFLDTFNVLSLYAVKPFRAAGITIHPASFESNAPSRGESHRDRGWQIVIFGPFGYFVTGGSPTFLLVLEGSNYPFRFCNVSIGPKGPKFKQNKTGRLKDTIDAI